MKGKVFNCVFGVAVAVVTSMSVVSKVYASENSAGPWVMKIAYDYLDVTAENFWVANGGMADQSGGTHGVTFSLGTIWGDENLVMLDATFRGGDIDAEDFGEGWSSDYDEKDIRLSYQKLWDRFQPFASVGYNSIEVISNTGDFGMDQENEFYLFAIGVGTGVQLFSNDFVQVSGKVSLDYVFGDSEGYYYGEVDGDTDGYRYKISLLVNVPFTAGAMPMAFFVDAGYQHTQLSADLSYGAGYMNSSEWEDYDFDIYGPYVRTGIVASF